MSPALLAADISAERAARAALSPVVWLRAEEFVQGRWVPAPDMDGSLDLWRRENDEDPVTLAALDALARGDLLVCTLGGGATPIYRLRVRQ